jgi:predicted DNA-binding transcriptional regulator AlpA
VKKKTDTSHTKQAPRKRAPAHDDQGVIFPDHFYRVSVAGKFFGYSPTVLHEKIRSGEIPSPVALSDGGRARGWFGRTILQWQHKRESTPASKVVFPKRVRP